MQMRRLLSFLLLMSLGALAQGEAELSLVEAEALWSRHSHELQLATTAVAGAAADVTAAGQIPNPQVSLNTLSISPWSGYGAGGWKDKKMDTQLRFDQVIERGGKRELRVKAAEARLDAARRDLDDAGRQQLLALRSAYYDLMLAQERFRVARDAADLYGKGLEAGKLRNKAGDISQVDLARLQIDKSRADNDVRQAQAGLEQAQAALAYLIGRELESRRIVAGDDWPAIEDSEPAMSVPETRPDVEAARLRLAAAESARELARAQKKRDVTVGVQLEHNLQNAPTNSYGFGVSMPLFVWHEYEGEIARAEAQLDAARRQYAMVLAQAVGSVDQARSALLSARERRQRLETGLLADAERVAKASEYAYARGASGLMDLLDARRTLRQVQVEAATARADYAKALAAWRLQAEFGKGK